MYRTALSLVALVAVATLAGTVTKPAAVAVAAPVVVAEPFWRCPSGFAFQTSGTAVHCKKAAWTETKAMMACIGATPTLKLDLVGTTDMCAGGIGIQVTAEPLCYPTDMAAGFTKRKVAGKDYCGKYHPAEIIPPNQMITL